LLAAVLASCWAAQDVRAALIEGQHDFHALKLESTESVRTWEQDGVRVFVAPEGALLRQGPVRLVAPRLVVWFDRRLSSDPEVRAATLRVYAEGIPGEDGAPSERVLLAEGDGLRECGALYLRLRSTLSFAWDCPLVRSEEPARSSLLVRAESLTRDLDEDTCWDEVPAPGPVEVFQTALRRLNAEEMHVSAAEDPYTAVYVGDVHGEVGNLLLRADAAVLWYHQARDVYEIYAEGNIRLERKPGAAPSIELKEGEPDVTGIFRSMRADQVYINPRRARGLATNTEVRLTDPTAEPRTVYVFRGEKTFLIDSQTLIMKEVSATTCGFARPHYQFKADTVQVMRQKPSTLLHAWNPRLQLGETPRDIIGLPFIGIDLSRRAYLLTDYALGSSGKFGFFVQTTWRPFDLGSPPAWIENWTVNLDYYGSRGPAIGTELLYEFGQEPYPRHTGRLRGYYVHDTGDEDETELPVPQESRGRLHLEHRSQFDAAWRLDAEYYHLSDEGFLNEYFEADFEEEKTPESYLLARYLRNSTYLAFLYKRRVNDFLTQTEETPTFDLEIVGLPLGRFVYEGSIQGGVYDLEFSDILAPSPADPPDLARMHTEHKLSIPFSIGMFRVDPFVRALATWTDTSAMQAGAWQDEEARSGVGGGITISTVLSRSFPTTSKLLDLNRLRHIVIPYVSFDALSVSGAQSAEFIQMDPVDAIDTGTQTVVGLRHRLLTKRFREGRWRSVEWAEMDVAYVARSSDSVVQALDQDYIRADLALYLSDHVSVHSRDDWIGLDDQADVLNFGMMLDYLPRWAAALDYDRISDLSSTVTLNLSYQLSDRYRLLLREQYELDSLGTGDEKNLETRLVIRRLLHEWILDMGFHIDEADGDFALVFGFGPAGWGFYDDRRRAAR